MRERRLDFLGYPKHIVRENGTVIGPRGPLKPRHNSSGYPVVRLHYKGYRRDYPIHRLLAIAFIPNPDNKPEVNHLDGNKSNYSLSNLEWVTGQENVRHAITNELFQRTHSRRRDRRRGE